MKYVSFRYILGGKTPSGRNCTPTAELTIGSRRITMAISTLPTLVLFNYPKRPKIGLLKGVQQ